MNQDLAEYALKNCKDVDYAEVRLEESSKTTFIMKNGVAEGGEFGDINGLAIRVLANGSFGFSSTNILEKTNIKEAVKLAIKTAKNSRSLLKQPLHLSKESAYNQKVIIKPKKNADSESPDEKLKFMQGIDKSLTGLKFKIPGRQMLYSNSMTKKLFLNTDGSNIYTEYPRLHFFWFITVMNEGKSKQKYLSFDETRGLEALKTWNLTESVALDAAALYNILKKGKKTPPGHYDVIAGPEVTGIAVHESVGHPYEADRILGREAAQAGESFVNRDMIGMRIGSDIVNVSDDPTIENSSGFYLFDDEGVKARKRQLIKNGMINEFLMNRETAATLGRGLRSNGAARAVCYDREPIVRMANTFMEPGDYEKDEIIQETKNGIYIKNFMEWNIDDRRYNQKYVGAEAYLIKNGEIKQPLINPAIEVTTPTFYRAIDAIGKDVEMFAGNCGKGEPMQAIPVWMGGPTIRLKNLLIK